MNAPLKGQYGSKIELMSSYGHDMLDIDLTRYQWDADTRPVLCDPLVYYYDSASTNACVGI